MDCREVIKAAVSVPQAIYFFGLCWLAVLMHCFALACSCLDHYQGDSRSDQCSAVVPTYLPGEELALPGITHAAHPSLGLPHLHDLLVIRVPEGLAELGHLRVHGGCHEATK
jgi:hypothetical protein